MNKHIRHSLMTIGMLALGTIYFVGCQSKPPETPMPPRQTALPNQPYVVKIAETGMWKWQYVASNNILIAESYETFNTPQEALRNYRAARKRGDTATLPSGAVYTVTERGWVRGN